MLCCPKCNRIVVNVTQDGGVKVRSRMILFNGTSAHAICPSCKTKVMVPLTIDTDSLPPAPPIDHVVQS